jgi:hypothetical protein
MKMQISQVEEHRLRHCAVRSSLVMITYELDRLLETPGLRLWCSQATVNLVRTCMKEKKALVVTRQVIMFARRAAQLASAMTWGPSTVDA